MSKDKKILWGVVAIALAILAWFTFCSAAKAGEPHDAAYYQRTATKPPMPPGDWFLPITGGWNGNASVAGGVGYLFHDSGLLVMGQVGYSRYDGFSGTTSFAAFDKRGCPATYQVPFTAPSQGQVGVGFTLAIPLNKRK